MSVLRYVRLDVFANQPFTGIQLAVFPDAVGIDERRMQSIANEMALPEITFVFPPEAPETDARARIFTPSQELPMAGSQIGLTSDACSRSQMKWLSPNSHSCFLPRLPRPTRGLAFSLHPKSCRWPGVRRLGRFLRSQARDGCVRAPTKRFSASA